MKIDIITLFPDMFKGPFEESIISRAKKKGLVKIGIHNLRDWAEDKHKTVDDKPYGGGAGMLVRADVVYEALTGVCGFRKVGSQKISNFQFPISNDGVASRPYIILPTPKGKKFDQKLAQKLSKKKHLVFICPHYEGYDHRIESICDEKISIGDYILTGGELPVMVMVDSIVRLIPGVIKKESLEEESFLIRRGGPVWPPQKGQPHRVAPTLEYPQYTRPEVLDLKIKGKKIKKRVPKILLSGNHALIAKWRRKKVEG